MARRRSRKVSITRVLQVSLPLLTLLGAGFIAIQFLWLRNAPWGAPHKSYEEFERDIIDFKVKKAIVDGNIIRAEYDGSLLAVVASPSVQRTVDIMMKKGVQVEAAQPVSASGLSLPVLLLALLPYPILAYFALGLVNSLGSSADFSETEKLLEPPQPAARERDKKERYRSEEDSEED